MGGSVLVCGAGHAWPDLLFQRWGVMTEKKLHVLIAEDVPEMAGPALRALYPEAEGSLEVTDVRSLSTLLPTISMVNPDVVLLDLNLARPDPVDAVRRVHRSAPTVPLIVLAESTNKIEATHCLEVGAVDYLLKEFLDERTIDRALRTALERNTLDALTNLLRDPLTNLYTRDALLTLGRRALETARRADGSLVLLCVLVENLANVYREFGSKAAEQTLCDLASLLSTCFRRTDVLARMGGAQFAALAVDAAEPSGPVLRQRVQRRVDTFNRLREAGSGIRLRMAVGFWSAREPVGFDKQLDRVEAELRTDASAHAFEMEQPANAMGQ